MPHREVLGNIDLASFHREFQPRTLTEGRTVTKALAAYLETRGTALLIECLVVEGHLRQGFFLIASTREGSVLVRVHPRSAPEKTPGVKRAVAWIAAWISARTPGATSGTTNLEPAALAEFPPDALV
jgi:hypothetical protein